MQSAQVSLWCLEEDWRAARAGVVVEGFNAIIVEFVAQMHLQKEPGVEVRAERMGDTRRKMVRRATDGDMRRRIVDMQCCVEKRCIKRMAEIEDVHRVASSNQGYEVDLSSDRQLACVFNNNRGISICFHPYSPHSFSSFGLEYRP